MRYVSLLVKHLVEVCLQEGTNSEGPFQLMHPCSLIRSFATVSSDSVSGQ